MIDIRTKDYLGSEPGAAFIVSLSDPGEISNYEVVEGDGVLVTVDSDLYITNAALGGAIPAGVSVIYGGTKLLPTYLTISAGLAEQSVLLLAGYTHSNFTKLSPGAKLLIGVDGAMLSNNTNVNGGAMLLAGTTISGLTFAANTSSRGGAIFSHGTNSLVDKVLFHGNSAMTDYGGAMGSTFMSFVRVAHCTNCFRLASIILKCWS